MTETNLLRIPVSCNLCGAETANPFLQTRGHNGHFVYLGEQAIAVSGKETIVRCRECGLVYVNPQPRVISPLSTYPPSEERRYFAHTRAARLAGARHLLNLVEGFLPSTAARLLDVGCGDAVLLVEAMARGMEVRGIEASSRLVAELRNGPLGERVVVQRAEELREEPVFDAVTLLNLLEHVWDPAVVLQRVWHALTVDGLVAVHVPNYGWGRSLGRYWRQLNPLDHLYYFTHETLTRLLEQSGFEVEARFSLPGLSASRARLQVALNSFGLWPGSGLGIIARKRKGGR